MALTLDFSANRIATATAILAISGDSGLVEVLRRYKVTLVQVDDE
jgi:hypothetical protein